MSRYDICLVYLRVIKVSHYSCISYFSGLFQHIPVNVALLAESLVV